VTLDGVDGPEAHPDSGTPVERSERSEGATAGSPDLLVRLVAGLYLGLLLSPPALAAIAASVSDRPWVLYLSFIGAVATISVATAVLLRRWRGMGAALGGGLRRWLPAVLPFVAGGLELLLVGTLEVRLGTGLWTAGVVGLLGAFIIGLLLATMTRTRAVSARVAGLDVDAAWRAGWPSRERRLVRVGAGIAVVVGVAGFGAGIFLGNSLLRMVGHLAIPIGAGLAGGTQPRTYRITAAGIDDTNSVVRRLYPWETITGYEVTAGALVVHREGLHRPALRWDRGDVENLDAVVAAFDRHLTRTE
jgi:hypothetical protein